MTNCYKCIFFKEDGLADDDPVCSKKLPLFPNRDCGGYRFHLNFKSCNEKLEAISKIMDEIQYYWNIDDSLGDIRDILEAPITKEVEK